MAKSYDTGFNTRVIYEGRGVGKINIITTDRSIIFSLAAMRKALDEISNNDTGKSGQADNVAVDTPTLAEGTILGGPSGGGTPTSASDSYSPLFRHELLTEIPVDTGRDAPDPWERLQGGDIG